LYKTTHAIATTLQPGKAKVNIGLNSLISLSWAIQQPYDAEAAVYKFTVRGDDHPETAFARDARQSVKKLADNSYELQVRVVPLSDDENATPPGDEFTKSNYFITSDDPEVRKHAQRAVGPTTDPWQKALNIEKYVHGAIKDKNYEEAFATASEVARNLKGDCTEHAVLAAAMCRAVGVPSRTAVGLLYVKHASKGPVLGFHMWTEVWIAGQWRPIDAVLGRGYVGATHLKISDHSWNDVQSLTPLFPIYRVLGKLDIQVERVQRRAQ
jgi:transglutaminase-like putative cysteine protease